MEFYSHFFEQNRQFSPLARDFTTRARSFGFYLKKSKAQLIVVTRRSLAPAGEGARIGSPLRNKWINTDFHAECPAAVLLSSDQARRRGIQHGEVITMLGGSNAKFQ